MFIPVLLLPPRVTIRGCNGHNYRPTAAPAAAAVLHRMLYDRYVSPDYSQAEFNLSSRTWINNRAMPFWRRYCTGVNRLPASATQSLQTFTSSKQVAHQTKNSVQRIESEYCHAGRHYSAEKITLRPRTARLQGFTSHRRQKKKNNDNMISA